MSDSNRELAERWMKEVWNDRRDATVDELFAGDAVGHMEGVPEVRGPDGFRQVRDALLAAFPDLTLTVEKTVAEGDSAVVRWKATATQKGDALGVPAAGRRVEFRGITWFDFADGRIREGWDAWNQLAVVQQLTAV